MSVVGGDIAIVGGPLTSPEMPSLGAPGGRIHIASIASSGEVGLNLSGQVPQLDTDAFERLGEIQIAQGAFLDTSGNGGGTTVIRGGRLLVNNALLAANNTGSVDSPGPGIDVRIRGDVTLTGEALIISTTDLFSQGRGGHISLAADNISIEGGATLSSVTGGRGPGGDIAIMARGTIGLNTGGSVSGGGILAGSLPFSSGSVGEIRVEAGKLLLTNGAVIGSLGLGSGKSGNITVSARESVAISGGNSQGTPSSIANFTAGEPGSISLSASVVTIDGGILGTPGILPGQRAGDIVVKADQQLSLVNGAQINSTTLTNSQGGNITIEAGRLTLTDGAQIISGTFGPGTGGNVTVTATDTLTLAGTSLSGRSSGIVADSQGTDMGAGAAGRIMVRAPRVTIDGGTINASTSGTGNAGSIDVQVGQLTLTGGAQISTSTFASGRGGDLLVTATEAISITGRGSELPQTGLFSVANGSGDAGHLFVSAPRLAVAGGRVLTRTLGASNAGDLEVHVGSLMLSEGGQIFSGTGLLSNSGVVGTAGLGRGGNLTIQATHSISIAGSDRQGFLSGLFSSAQIGSGQAGNLSVSTPLLTLSDGGLIVADTLSTSSGNAGNIEVRAGRLTLSGGGQISSSTSSSGRGGDVTVATDHIELSSGGAISARSFGLGNAGNIVIQADQIFQSRNGAVTTEAEQADGGNIQLTAGSQVELRDSQITATVKTGVGKGGNILIDPQFVILQRGQVRADAFGGPGGNVRIVAGVFLADPASKVSASSELGINGVVNIQAPVTSLSGAVAPLPQEFAAAAELLRDRCAGRLREGRVSRLVLGGRDGVPSEPGSLLLSPLMQTDPREHGEQTGLPARTGQGQEHAWHAQAGTLAGLEAECARWTGQRGPAIRKQ
jgi:large exoprotein involved in heme utilization and adhesion